MTEPDPTELRDRVKQGTRRPRSALVRRVFAVRVVSLLTHGLADSGWCRSARERIPVDRDGGPAPWITYAARRVLQDRVPPAGRVFEYGAGQSTLWWAGLVREVVSCESDPGWAARVRARAPTNVRIIEQPLGPGYEAAIDGEGPFGVVLVDGYRRNECAPHVLDALSPDGVVVWDNADLDEHAAGLAALGDAGFRRLDLWGLAPANPHLTATAILYRDTNCVGL